MHLTTDFTMMLLMKSSSISLTSRMVKQIISSKCYYSYFSDNYMEARAEIGLLIELYHKVSL